MKTNDIEIIYRIHEGLVGNVKGTFAGVLSLDDGFSMIIVKKSKNEYHYVPLIMIVHLTSSELFTNLPEEIDDRSCA